MQNRGKSLLFSLLSGISVYAIANNTPLEQEESSVATLAMEAATLDDSYFENDASVLIYQADEDIRNKKFISPYNFLQNPIALNLGYDAQEKESGPIYHGGTSLVVGANMPTNGQNKAINTDVLQLWGQTSRYAGFAVGGTLTAYVNFSQVGQPNTFATTGVATPSQLYLNYQYGNIVDVTAGNLLITTPWVNSKSSLPGTTYALGNDSYQGVLVNVQALDNLLITGFTAWSYLQYPNTWEFPVTLYNTASGPLAGLSQRTTSGPTGLGMIWRPTSNYMGQVWAYNFANFAQMAYLDNSLHLSLSSLISLDVAAQAFHQQSTGNSFYNPPVTPDQPATNNATLASNGLGAKITLSLGPNNTSIAYNNIFGNGSFLNGGMVSPYTYGLETDPLYTTPALTSLAELGSGYAYTIRNTTGFLDNQLKLNLSVSNFYVNQVYSTQPNQVTEYDAGVIYRIPHTTLNLWSRLVYVSQPLYSGSSKWQPRLIVNWTF